MEMNKFNNDYTYSVWIGDVTEVNAVVGGGGGGEWVVVGATGELGGGLKDVLRVVLGDMLGVVLGDELGVLGGGVGIEDVVLGSAAVVVIVGTGVLVVVREAGADIAVDDADVVETDADVVGPADTDVGAVEVDTLEAGTDMNETDWLAEVSVVVLPNAKRLIAQRGVRWRNTYEEDMLR
jgi:hypothetical protein